MLMLGKTWFSLPSSYLGNQLLEVTSLLSLNVYHGNQERKNSPVWQQINENVGAGDGKSQGYTCAHLYFLFLV